jgi:hypothetical protein
MRDCDGIHVFLLNGLEERQSLAAFTFRVHPRVEQNPMPLNLHKPGTGPDLRVGVQIDNTHVR